MALTDIWFLLIAVLWTGYLVLEGFDFGVGMLLPFVGRDAVDRKVTLRTIGPVWDGNEVWLLVAGGATFAAFPFWYATPVLRLLPRLLIILVALILRGIALEYRGKLDDAAWHRRWDLVIVGGSAVPALLWGVALANIVRGVPMDADHEYAGTFFTLLNPYALLGGVTTLAAVRPARRDLPRAEDARRGPRPGRQARAAARVGDGRRGRRVPRLDADAGRVVDHLAARPGRRALPGRRTRRLRLGREGWAFLGTAAHDRAGLPRPCSPPSTRTCCRRPPIRRSASPRSTPRRRRTR